MEQKKNFGFAILKVWMALEVVYDHSSHFGSDSILEKIFGFFYSTAVPVFMILAFVFFCPKANNIKYVLKRIKQLLYLQISWAAIYYIIKALSHYLVHKELINISCFFSQALLGVGLNGPMWFQFDILVLTVIISIMYITIKNKKIIYSIMFFLFIICYALQITGVNYSLFNQMAYPYNFSFGRIVEMIPYSIFGCVISEFNLLAKLEKKALFVVFELIMVILVIANVEVPTQGFYYSGINDLFKALLLIVAFNEMNKYINGNSIIIFITKYTTGVYCVHSLLLNIITKLNEYVSIDYMKNFLLLYIVSYVTCLVIDKIPIKRIKALVN